VYITNENATIKFKAKPKYLQDLINEALYILETLGIPLIGLSGRRLERMAMAFLAVADVQESAHWSNLKDHTSGRSLKTRDIINYINQNFFEKISSGSYDDIRRKDLELLVQANIVINTIPDAAMNDSRRGYAVSSEYADVIRTFRPRDWHEPKRFLEGRATLHQKLSSSRDMKKTIVTLPSGIILEFSPGEHNDLQKSIIEDFLPRYGHNAQILYIGDTANKFLILESEKLQNLNFFELSHGKLPDIIAYSESKNWLYLIEAVHSSGPISSIRLLNLKDLTKSCRAGIIYVTAFLNRETFRKFVGDIAWETEVWIASEPDHLIHFDGHQFLGPYP